MSYHLIIPAAGQAIRAFPFTGFGSTPKPFVAMGEKTVFDHIMAEALASGVQHLTLVVSERSGGAEVYERYFDPFANAPQLQATVAAKMPDMIAWHQALRQLQVAYVDQAQPLGFGHAVGLAYPTVNSECSGVLVALGDDLLCGSLPGMQQLIDVHRQVGGMVFMVDEVSRDDARRFGVAQLAETIPSSGQNRGVFRVSEVVEKPANPQPNRIDEQERYFAVVGRYLLEFEDLQYLAEQQPSPGRELDFTPLFARKAKQGQLTAILPQGRFCTVGNATDLQKSNIRFALEPFRHGRHPELAQEAIDALIDVGALTYNHGQWMLSPSLQGRWFDKN